MIKIIIADDHPVVREGLKQIISQSKEMIVVDEAFDGSEVLEKLDKIECDVLMLDFEMPGRDGFDVLKDIQRLRPELPVLMLSVHPEDQIALRALRMGAAGYLNKVAAPKELVNAIKKIYSGGKYVSSSLAEKLVIGLTSKEPEAPHEKLSDREFQTLRLIVSGKDVEEIAEEMFISVKTVRTYRDRILEKLNMKNNVELTHYAIKHKLFD
ncbi:MAG: response regulator transcription factor [Bacteroidota bacterium]|nr:response regulator transcription factor [Bacteroidota bacterium]MDP4190459.1 response regulator transcription factor [Bacteroidota bacterium]MDP4194167.1 response regulator transcription factor [Bacteroidota bacterium]